MARSKSALISTRKATIHGARTLPRPNNQLMRIRRWSPCRRHFTEGCRPSQIAHLVDHPQTRGTLRHLSQAGIAGAVLHHGCHGEGAGQHLRRLPAHAVQERHRHGAGGGHHLALGRHEVGAPNRPWLQAVRIVVAFGSTLGFFYVFPRMPLVDAYAISFAAPLFMVALSVPMLGEPVGWRRWTRRRRGLRGRADHARSLGHRVPCHVADRAGRHLLLLAVDRHAAAAEPP